MNILPRLVTWRGTHRVGKIKLRPTSGRKALSAHHYFVGHRGTLGAKAAHRALGEKASHDT